jgi:hypothetical protein
MLQATRSDCLFICSSRCSLCDEEWVCVSARWLEYMNLRCSATHQDLRAETTRSGHRSRQMLDYIGCSKLTRGLTACHNRLRIGMCSETTSTCKQERILSRTCDTAPTASASNTKRARRTRRMSSFCVAAACSATVNRHFNLAACVALSVRCTATPAKKQRSYLVGRTPALLAHSAACGKAGAEQRQRLRRAGVLLAASRVGAATPRSGPNRTVQPRRVLACTLLAQCWLGARRG